MTLEQLTSTMDYKVGQVSVGDEVVLPVNNSIDLDNIGLCDKCKTALHSALLKAFGYPHD